MGKRACDALAAFEGQQSLKLLFLAAEHRKLALWRCLGTELYSGNFGVAYHLHQNNRGNIHVTV